MKATIALLQLLGVPLLALNIFGGIVSGVWLAFLGDWAPIVQGLLGTALSWFGLAIALWPSLSLSAPCAILAEKS